ncbi:MAG: hypothetical protein IKI64_05905 [Clostridia bacterium]|nr:hypothetical protein [Clostridia bacterium]
MDKQTLIRYLEDVVELEKQVFLQQQTLDALDSKIRSLGVKKVFYEPRYVNTPTYNEPTYNKPKETLANEGEKIGCITGLVVVGVILAGIVLMTFTDFMDDGALWIIVILSAIITPIAAAIIISNNKKKRAQDDYDSRVAENKADYNRRLAEQNADYDRRMAEYRRNVSEDAQRVNRELAEKRILEQERSALYQKHLQTKQVLQSYYDLDIIYGKYRNFVAVSSFVDYFKSGSCSTLSENTGGDGAYNKFDIEVRLDRIIDRLDDIIRNLDQIKSNQWCIYNAIQEGNRIARRLVSATESLAESNAQIALSSAQTAQYSAQTAQYSAKTAQYAGITAANSAIAAYNAQQAANEAEQLRKLKQYELGIRSTRY